MHVILGILTALITVLYLLDRMGIDLGGMNPFYWRRRRAWAKKYEGDPIYSVENPMEIAAVLIVGAAKLDGDLSAEQKRVAQEQFESNFSLSEREASQLITSATHLLGAPQLIDTQLQGLVDKSNQRFSTEQADSLLEMMTNVATADGSASERQRDFVEYVREKFTFEEKGEGPWAS